MQNSHAHACSAQEEQPAGQGHESLEDGAHVRGMMGGAALGVIQLAHGGNTQGMQAATGSSSSEPPVAATAGDAYEPPPRCLLDLPQGVLEAVARLLPPCSVRPMRQVGTHSHARVCVSCSWACPNVNWTPVPRPWPPPFFPPGLLRRARPGRRPHHHPAHHGRQPRAAGGKVLLPVGEKLRGSCLLGWGKLLRRGCGCS